MVYSVEEFLDVQVHNPVVSCFYIPACHPDRIVGSPPGSEPVARLGKGRVKDGRKDLQKCLLDEAV